MTEYDSLKRIIFVLNDSSDNHRPGGLTELMERIPNDWQVIDCWVEDGETIHSKAFHITVERRSVGSGEMLEMSFDRISPKKMNMDI